MDTPPVVEPKVEGTPAETPADESSLPADLIQIPAVQGVLAGQPAAVSMNIQTFGKQPEAQVIAANKDALLNAGMAFYRSLSGDLGAIFNRAYLTDEDIKQADKAGKLESVAPPFEQVNLELGGAGSNHPVLKAEAPSGLKTPQAPAMPDSVPAPSASPAPRTDTKALRAKVRNLSPGSPASGPSPGAGRLLNNILKPVI